MSSSKRKLAVEKSTSDDKFKVSVFDRLGPGISSRASEIEVSSSNLSGHFQRLINLWSVLLAV